MALDTYAGLKAALASLLNRDDLDSAIPDFVSLFEADFDADVRTAHHRRRICRSTAEISNEYETLAANYLSVQSIGLETDPVQWLQYVDPDSMERLVQDASGWRANLAAAFGSTPAPPKYYTIVGTEIRFFPAPQATYTADLTVYERLDKLVDDTDTNWALTYFPQAYLYGSAVHSAPYLGADERMATWQALYEAAVVKVMSSDPVATSKLPLRTEIAGLSRRFYGARGWI